MKKVTSKGPKLFSNPSYIVVSTVAGGDTTNLTAEGHSSTFPDPWLEELIRNRIQRSSNGSLLQIIVFHDGPSADGIEKMRFSPLVNPISGSRYGDANFVPFWDAVLDHGGWFEMILSIGVYPVTYVLFVIDDDAINPDFRRMCRQFAL